MIFIGYVGIMAIDFGTKAMSNDLSLLSLVLLLVFLAAIFTGVIYGLYWLISTSRTLRTQTNQQIPHGILLFIPLVNYYWMWRYSQAAEEYTGGKQQAALIFVLLAAVGTIGMGILQDIYNKQNARLPEQPINPTQPPAPLV